MTARESLADLIQKIALQDQAAFQRFYAAFSRRIFTFVKNHLHCDEMAKEVVVDTMLAVWRSAFTFGGRSKPEVWVLGIAHNKLLDRLDKERRHQGDYLEDMGDWQNLLGTCDDCEQDRMRQDLSEGVRLCMDKLGVHHRESLTLVYFDQLTVAQASEVVGVPEGTIKTRLFHAKQKLKNCVNKLKGLL
jgi:RNA polymerase sigma-70 factor, ECF subfamily